MIRPFSCAVCALNAFVNSTMLTPCWPSAGPTGGAGFACPPGICSLMSVRTFLAIGVRAGPRPSSYLSSLVDLLDLVERELDRDLALEDVHEHLELLRVRVDVDDLAVEVGERARRHLDGLAEGELDLRPRRRCARHAARVQDPVDLGLRERRGLCARADEGRHAGRALDHRPRVVVQVHVDEDVPVQHPLLGLDLLAVLRLDELLGRHDDATEPGLLVHGDDPVLEVGLHLVLVPGVGVYHVPVEHRRSRLPLYCPRSTSRTNGRRIWSAPLRYAPTIAQAMMTTIVPWITWARFGHSTLRSSATDSRTKPPRTACSTGWAAGSAPAGTARGETPLAGVSPEARRASRRWRLVSPAMWMPPGLLPRLAVERVRAAPAAILAKLDPVGRVALRLL